jgi:hypothetical protein
MKKNKDKVSLILNEVGKMCTMVDSLPPATKSINRLALVCTAYKQLRKR